MVGPNPPSNMTLHTHTTNQYAVKLFINILLTIANKITLVKVTVMDNTCWWPWEFMVPVTDRFLENP